MAAADASGSTVLTAPPYPFAVAFLSVPRSSADAGVVTAPAVTLNARAVVTAATRLLRCGMVAPGSLQCGLTVLSRYSAGEGLSTVKTFTWSGLSVRGIRRPERPAGGWRTGKARRATGSRRSKP